MAGTQRKSAVHCFTPKKAWVTHLIVKNCLGLFFGIKLFEWNARIVACSVWKHWGIGMSKQSALSLFLISQWNFSGPPIGVYCRKSLVKRLNVNTRFSKFVNNTVSNWNWTSSFFSVWNDTDCGATQEINGHSIVPKFNEILLSFTSLTSFKFLLNNLI